MMYADEAGMGIMLSCFADGPASRDRDEAAIDVNVHDSLAK
jgi:hypothetical protein